MVNKGIVLLLLKCLKRESSSQLTCLVIVFLKKLSIFGGNKDQMHQLGIADRLCSLVRDLPLGTGNLRLVVPLLELMVNLSFDSTLRAEMSA